MSLASKVLSLLFFVSLCIVFVIGFHVPIYSDEIGWKIMTSRVFLDHFQINSINPQCAVPGGVSLSPFLFPGRIFESFLFSNLSHPEKLRFIGFIISSLLFISFFISVQRCLVPFDGTSSSALTASSFFALGTLPLGLVLSRPEQTLLLLLIFFLSLPFYKSNSFFHKYVFYVCLLLTISMFFGTHPKSLFFSLAIFITIFFLPISFIKKLFFLVIGILTVWSSFRLNSILYGCDINPRFKALINTYMLSVESIFELDLKLILSVIRNLYHSTDYFSNLLFLKRHPNTPLTGIDNLTFSYQVLNGLIIFVFLCVVLWIIFSFIKILKNWSKTPLDRYRFFMALSLATGLFGLAVLQSGKNAYESNFFVPCIILIAALLTGHSAVSATWKRISKWSCIMMVSISIFSQWGLIYRFGPNLKTVWKRGPFLLDRTAQVEQLKRACRLEDLKSLKHLVVDDRTYPYLWQSQEPYHALYLTGYWSVGIDNLESFLTERKSAGYLASCHYLPPNLAVRAKRSGDLCCIDSFY